MADRWVVDDEYPEGHLVPMTADEEDQRERDQAAAAVAADAQATLDAQAEARIAGLRRARSELAAGVIFASLSASEKHVIDMLLQDELIAR